MVLHRHAVPAASWYLMSLGYADVVTGEAVVRKKKREERTVVVRRARMCILLVRRTVLKVEKWFKTWVVSLTAYRETLVDLTFASWIRIVGRHTVQFLTFA